MGSPKGTADVSFRLAMASPALVDLDSGATLPRAAFDAAVDGVARALQARRGRGVGLVVAHASIATVVAHFALLRAGWVSMLVPSGSREEALDAWRLAYAPDVVVDDDRPALGDERGTIAGLRAVWGNETSDEVPPGCAVLLPTSGSTGSPRFVRLSAGALDANADAVVATLDVDADDVGLIPIPLAFAYGLSVLHSHAIRGATLALTARSVADRGLWPAIAGAGVTSIPSVPYGYQLLARMGFLGVELPRLRLMTQAGGRLDPVLASQFLDALEPRGVRFQAMYGQSEATARIAVVPPAFARTKLGSAGRAVPGTTLSVEEGRVRVRGPSVMLGYAEGRRDLGRGDELGGVLDTGDLGSIDDDGFLWIQGRSSRFTKLFGVRFNLDDLEASLASFGPVAVVERQEKLVVVMEERAEPRRVLDALATRFGLQPMSVRVRTGEPLPRLASGKVAYGELA